MGKTGKVIINNELCKACLLCIPVCKKQLLKEGEERNKQGYIPVVVIPNDECTGCALCAQTCPDIAIEVWK